VGHFLAWCRDMGLFPVLQWDGAAVRYLQKHCGPSLGFNAHVIPHHFGIY